MEELNTFDLAKCMIHNPNYAELPARIDGKVAAKLLGFNPHDIPILMRKKHLTPLGNPKSNSPKFFHKLDIFKKSIDSGWLSKATKCISENWRCKNAKKESATF